MIQVSGGGDALRTAAASAAPGTVFELQPGGYNSLTWTVPDATIIGSPRATLIGPLHVATAAGSLVIRNVDVFNGQRFGGYYYYPDPGWISSSGATLIIEDSTSRGLRLRDCAVYVTGSRLGGESTSARLENVDAAFVDSTIDPGYFFSSYGFSSARPAMRAINSRVRLERTSVTGSNVYGSYYVTAGQGLVVEGQSIVTAADCTLVGGPGSSFGQVPPAPALSVASGSTVTLSSTTINGPTTGSFANALLATAEWTAPGLTPGGTATARFTEGPSMPVAVLLSFDFVPFSTPLVAEPLFVFGSANWTTLAAGLTDGLGEFSTSLTVPAATSFQNRPIWLTGLFGGSLPVRSTAPLGGVIR